MKIFFAGSFNPFTKGHADILKRLLGLADEVVVGIGMNIDKPGSRERAEQNKKEVAAYVAAESLGDRVEVMTYSGLTAQAVASTGCTCMARGVRNASDFDYEYSLAVANRDAFGIETLLIPADPSLSFISSSLVRELKHYGREDLASKYKI